MKITQERIRVIIREELQSLNESKKVRGLSDDVKKFRTEYDIKHGKLKEKALKLHERQQIMKAVGMVNEKIMEMISELNKLPVADALENVKKTHSNKYIRAIETLKGICEHNTVWLKENK
jgi:3-methyladenine DNA glycosylase AlkC